MKKAKTADPNIIIRGFKVRLHPTPEQDTYMREIAYRCRKVWNWALGFQIDRRKNGLVRLGRFEMERELKNFKNEPENKAYLSVPAISLNKVMHTLILSFARMKVTQKELSKNKQSLYSKKTIRRCKEKGIELDESRSIGHPRFKSWYNCDISFRTNYQSVKFKEGFVNLEKIGLVKFSYNYKEQVFDKNTKINDDVRVKFVNGKWMLSFSMDVPKKQYELTDSVMGIDLGVDDLAIASCDGNKQIYDSLLPGKKQRSEKTKTLSTKIERIGVHIKSLQKKLSRSDRLNEEALKEADKRHTERYVRLRSKLNGLYAKLANMRDTYTHQFTHEVVAQAPKAICVENLDVKQMTQHNGKTKKELAKRGSKQMPLKASANRSLNRHILANNFYEIKRQFEYKGSERNILLVKAPKTYPSTQTCSSCGFVKTGEQKMQLKDRVYICPKCGMKLDRDLNAARNLESLAREQL